MRDFRKAFVAFILVVCLIVMMMTILADADDRIRTSARSAVVYQSDTATFPYAKNADEKLAMASTTKIMTGIIAIERLDPEEEITVPSEAVEIEGSSLYLSEGDVISVKDLLYGLLLQSANDAAVVLALMVSGDIASFASLMNEKAESLSLSSTHFENPHGLDSDEHYTTARDLALLAAYALDNPTFREIVSTYKHSFSISGKERVVVNHNKLLKRYDGCIGVKTGYTDKSGRCLVSAAEKDGVRLIAVTLDAPSDWADHTAMLDYCFPSYRAIDISAEIPTELKIPVIGGNVEEIGVKADSSNESIVVMSDDDIEIKRNLKQYLVAPFNSGDEIGEAVVYRNGEPIRTYKYRTDGGSKRQKFNIFDIFKRG